MFYLIADEEDLAKEMPGTSHDEVLRLLEEMNKMENGVSTSDKKLRIPMLLKFFKV